MAETFYSLTGALESVSSPVGNTPEEKNPNTQHSPEVPSKKMGELMYF